MNWVASGKPTSLDTDRREVKLDKNEKISTSSSNLHFDKLDQIFQQMSLIGESQQQFNENLWMLSDKVVKMDRNQELAAFSNKSYVPPPSTSNFAAASPSAWCRPCNVAHREDKDFCIIFALVAENYAETKKGFT
jgi:hypothetical protein